jgi:hypothetical protein
MTSVEVFGVKAALKELSALDKDLRKEINAEAKTIAKPAVDGIKGAYPTQYLSGMSKPWVSSVAVSCSRTRRPQRVKVCSSRLLQAKKTCR